MDHLIIKNVNESFIQIHCDNGIKQELNDFFSFYSDNYKFHPKYKAGFWDGKIRLFSYRDSSLPRGLIHRLIEFCEDREYTYEHNITLSENVNSDYGYELAEKLKIPEHLKLRDYQNEYIVTALRERRSISLSPTSSGKSLIIYLIQQHYFRTENLRTLLIVPRAQLVEQMKKDFIEYGCDPEHIHLIPFDKTKKTQKPIVISTWQSLKNVEDKWFEQFDVVHGDEVHLFEAEVLKSILAKLVNCEYRHGFTGTLKTKVHHLSLEGSFGKIKRYVTTKDLINRKTVSDLKIYALLLEHSKEEREQIRLDQKKVKDKKKHYAIEKNYVVQSEAKNKYIRNLVWKLKDQNNLILFSYVEKHGDILRDLLEHPERTLHYIHGGTPAEEREQTRSIIESDPNKNHNILASFGVFSTGINIKRLDNLILADSSKAEITLLQSIGRVLRRGHDSTSARLFDLGTTFQDYKSSYSLKHFNERLKLYTKEGFPIKVHKIKIY